MQNCLASDTISLLAWRDPLDGKITYVADRGYRTAGGFVDVEEGKSAKGTASRILQQLRHGELPWPAVESWPVKHGRRPNLRTDAVARRFAAIPAFPGWFS